MNEEQRHQGAAPETGFPTVLGNNVPAGEDRLLTAGEVAVLLNVEQSWVRSATRSGSIPCVPLPGRWKRYRRQSILDWVEQLEQPGRPVKLRSVEPKRR